MSEPVSARIDAVRVEMDVYNVDAQLSNTEKFSLAPDHPIVELLRAERYRQVLAAANGSGSWEGIL